jgi:hypothetical protein
MEIGLPRTRKSLIHRPHLILKKPIRRREMMMKLLKKPRLRPKLPRRIESQLWTMLRRILRMRRRSSRTTKMLSLQLRSLWMTTKTIKTVLTTKRVRLIWQKLQDKPLVSMQRSPN